MIKRHGKLPSVTQKHFIILLKDTELTNGNKNGSKGSFQCLKDYQLNFMDSKGKAKIKTAVTCMCLFDEELDDFKCEWNFNKGNVMCTYCPKEIIAGKDGNGILGRVMAYYTLKKLRFPTKVYQIQAPGSQPEPWKTGVTARNRKNRSFSTGPARKFSG